MDGKIWLFSLEKRSLKGIVLHLLTLEWPQSTKELLQKITKEFRIKISYQAVHKALHQLVAAKCIYSQDKKYQINREWVMEVSEHIEYIKKRFSETDNTDGDHLFISKNSTVHERIEERKAATLLERFIPILKEEYKIHNIFTKDKDFILDYLLELQKKNEILLYCSGEIVLGGVVLLKIDEDTKKSYIRWQLRHFACRSDVSIGQRIAFIKKVEQRVCRQSKNIKLEYNLSEHEKEYLQLFATVGYKKEATFQNKYRLGEKAYLYSKFLSN